jgi:predicted permease
VYILYQLTFLHEKLYNLEGWSIFGCITFSLTIFFQVIHRMIEKGIYNQMNFTYFLLIMFSVSILLFSSLFNHYIKSEKIKDGISTTNLEFRYENKIVRTNKYFMYIGSSQAYIFCYDRLFKRTEIFKKDDLKELKISVIKP